MKRGILFIALFVFLILNISFALSAINSSSVSDKGYACLTSKVQGQCSTLSTEEKIFSMLAIGQCKSELLSDATNSECWSPTPQAACTTKTTAQAMLALKGSMSLNKSATWLSNQRMNPPGITPLLQIDTVGIAKCTISYPSSSGTSSITVSIDENKQLTSTNLGTCFGFYSGGSSLTYALIIKSPCFDKEITILCDDSFTTNILYEDSASSTTYVFDELNSAAAEGTTKETASSYCLKQGSSCDYEGTLWAALALENAGYDYKSYIPYLIAKQDLNEQFLPESFLYVLLGGSYEDSLLARQQQSKWWVASGDKFYDTAIALYPFQQKDLTEKSNAIGWLTSVQGTDGCWQENIRNTAFLLYSVWPKKIASISTPGQDCAQNNYFCLSKANCDSAGGTNLSYTGCVGSNICCSKQAPLSSCSTLGGTVCSSDKVCSIGTTQSSDGACCTGTCDIPETNPSCSSKDGTCKSSCSDSETESSYECSGGDTCCLAKSTGGTSYLGIILLSVLILLVLLGILFRKKLKLFLQKFKKGGKNPKSPQSRMPPRGFPPSSQIPQRMMPRRIIPSQTQPRPAYRPTASPTAGKSKETDEVLKKLKEMGK